MHEESTKDLDIGNMYLPHLLCNLHPCNPVRRHIYTPHWKNQPGRSHYLGMASLCKRSLQRSKKGQVKAMSTQHTRWGGEGKEVNEQSHSEGR